MGPCAAAPLPQFSELLIYGHQHRANQRSYKGRELGRLGYRGLMVSSLCIKGALYRLGVKEMRQNADVFSPVQGFG